MDMMKVKFEHGFEVDVPTDLTVEQYQRLMHHVDVSRQVFEASVKGMLKGVQKYGPEPEVKHPAMQFTKPAAEAVCHWLPHIFSEAVDAANQTALFADALGVSLDSDAG